MESKPQADKVDHTSKPKLTLSKEWSLILDKYHPNKIIGMGASGQVVRARDKNQNNVAIKFIKSGFHGGYDYLVKRVLSEIQILRHLTQMEENVHTVKILDLIVSENLHDIFIVMNYVKSDLNHALKHFQKSPDEKDIKTILFKFLCAVNFIHKANVMHRDLKPSNILIDANHDLLLCDFGLARTSNKIESAKKQYDRESMSEKLRSNREGR